MSYREQMMEARGMSATASRSRTAQVKCFHDTTARSSSAWDTAYDVRDNNVVNSEDTVNYYRAATAKRTQDDLGACMARARRK